MSGSVLFDAPGPRARRRNRVISLAVLVVAVITVSAVLARLADKGQLAAAKWHPFLTADLWRTYVWPGIEGTLTAAAMSVVLAGILGVGLGWPGCRRTAGSAARPRWSSSSSARSRC